MNKHVFISHANQDKKKMRPLVEALLEQRFNLWLDRPEDIGLSETNSYFRSILSGRDWHHEITRGLEESACVLFLLSRAANDSTRSDYLFREFEYGKQHDKLVIAKIDDIPWDELNPFFRIRHFIDLKEYLEDSRALSHSEQFDRLATRLRKFVGTNVFPKKAGNKIITPPPRLLPYLCDRQEQNRRLRSIIQNHLDHGNKSTLSFIITGREDQCVDAFMEQVETVTVPRILRANMREPKVHRFVLQWPMSAGQVLTGSSEEIRNYGFALISEVKERFGLRLNSSDKSLVEALKSSRASCSFNLGLALEDWRERQIEIVKHWLLWWRNLNISNLEYPMIAVVTITYRKMGLYDFVRGRSVSAVQSSFKALAKQYVGLHVLPELGDVGQRDLDPWIHDHAPDRDPEVLKEFLRKKFSRRHLPMMKVVNLLKLALSNTEQSR